MEKKQRKNRKRNRGRLEKNRRRLEKKQNKIGKKQKMIGNETDDDLKSNRMKKSITEKIKRKGEGERKQK